MTNIGTEPAVSVFDRTDGTAGVPAPNLSPTRRLRGRPGTALWPMAFSLLVLLTVCCAALAPLLRATAWWWVVTAVGAAVLLGAAVFRRFGVPRPFVPLANVAVFTATLTLFFGSGTGFFWIIPTPTTIATLSTLAEAGRESIAQQNTPAEVTFGILFLLAGGTALIALLLDLFVVTLRLGAVGAAPAVVPLLIPGFIIDDGATTAALVAAVIAFLVVLRVDVSGRRAREVRAGETLRAHQFTRPRGPRLWGGALFVGSLTIVGALLLGAIAPAVTGGSSVTARPGGLLFGTGVSPMINLGQDLRRPKAGPAFSYTSTGTGTEQPYFTLLILDEIIGLTWTARIDGASTENTVDDIARAEGLGFDVDTTEVSTSVDIDGVNSHWLPAPARATSIDGLSGSWYWNGRTGAIASVTANTLNQKYTVSSLGIKPTADQLRQSSADYPEGMGGNLQLPEEVPPIITQTAQSITAQTTSRYDAAVAMQNYLRSSAFTYDVDSPVDDGYDGGGLDVIGVFLEEKRGYCIHFAATMATMARSLGIPSRVSLGYLPGVKSQDREQGLGQYLVDSHDLHSWPELYFVGVGWVKFEPTPGRGTVPSYEEIADADVPAATPVAPVAPAAPGAERPVNDSAFNADVATPNSQLTQQLTIVGVSVLGLLILLLPALARVLLRRIRLGRIRLGAANAELAWLELVHTGQDHGIAARATDTPRAFGARLEKHSVLDAAPSEALQRLLLAVERLRFDRPESDQSALPAPPSLAEELATDLSEVLRAVHGSASMRVRLRATLAPPSLSAICAALLRGERPVRPFARQSGPLRER